MGKERKDFENNLDQTAPSEELLLKEKTDSVLETFRMYSANDIPLEEGSLRDRVTSSLSQNLCVEFIQFSCPRIEASKLNTESPEDYISTDTRGNNFETTSGRLAKLIKQLGVRNIPSFVNILLIDTDEEDYIFPVLGSPQSFRPEVAETKKVTYFSNLSLSIKNQYAAWLTSEVYRWSQIRMIQPQKIPSLDPADLNDEVKRLEELFQDGNYYGGFALPQNSDLVKIAKLKFLAYADQGYQISRFFPNAVLLQNEFPLELRTRMINLKNDSGTKIPAIYPYGRSQSPY